MVNKKVVIGVYIHAESKSGLYFVLTLFIHRFWPLFSPNTLQFLPVFRKLTRFLVKLGSQILLNISPCPGLVSNVINTIMRHTLWYYYYYVMSALRIVWRSYFPKRELEPTCLFGYWWHCSWMNMPHEWNLRLSHDQIRFVQTVMKNWGNYHSSFFCQVWLMVLLFLSITDTLMWSGLFLLELLLCSHICWSQLWETWRVLQVQSWKWKNHPTPNLWHQKVIRDNW